MIALSPTYWIDKMDDEAVLFRKWLEGKGPYFEEVDLKDPTVVGENKKAILIKIVKA